MNPAGVEGALVRLIAHSPAEIDVRIDLDRLRDLRSQQINVGDEVDVMADFLHVGDDADADADEPVNEGHPESVEGVAERDVQGVDAPPNPVHDLDDDDSDEEVRDPEDSAGGGTQPRREPLDDFIPSSGGGGISEQDAVRQALEELAGCSDENSLVNYPARSEPWHEDTTTMLASMCFPVMFPLGVGDPFHVGHQRRGSLADDITHLMKFADQPPPVDGFRKPSTTGSPATAASGTGA